MNEKCGGGGPNLGLLLLIPAAMILAKGMKHRRAMWASEWGHGPGDPGREHGRHVRFGGGAPETEGRAAFQLPPRIERVLDAWHAGAHRAAEPAERATA